MIVPVLLGTETTPPSGLPWPEQREERRGEGPRSTVCPRPPLRSTAVRSVICGAWVRGERRHGGLKARFGARGLGESRHNERRHGGPKRKSTARPRPSSADSSVSDDN